VAVQSTAAGAGASNITNVQNDINYNKRIKKLSSQSGYLFEKKLFWLALSPFFLFFIAAFTYRAYRRFKNGDPVSALKAEAENFSKECVINAERKINPEHCHDFYEAMYEALAAAVTARTGIRSDNLSAAQMKANLEKSGFEQSLLKDTEEILNRLNFYRFASVSSDERSMRALLSKIKEILNCLRKE
jgi:hypothetical protein